MRSAGRQAGVPVVLSGEGLLCGGGLLFEELGDEWRGLFGEFVGAALENEGDKGCADFGGVEGAVLGPGGALWGALIDLFDFGHGELLPCVFDEGVLGAGEVHAGLGLEGGVFEADGGGCGWGDGAEDVRSCLPEEVGEAAAVGVAGGEDAFGVHLEVFFEVGECGVEKFEVAVALRTCAVLPAGFFAFGVGELAWGVEALEIDRDGLGPEFVHGNAAADLHGVAAVAVPDEDDGGWLFFGGGRHIQEPAACDAVHGEFELLYSLWKLNLGGAG